MTRPINIFLKFIGFIIILSISYYLLISFTYQHHHKNKILNIYTWVDFIPISLQQKFESETGIRLQIDYMDSDESLESKLLMNTSEYDLVYPSTPYVFKHIDLGLYHPLDLKEIPNIIYIDHEFIQEFIIDDQLFAVPYIWGSSGFAYNTDWVQPLFHNQNIDSWSYVFDIQTIKPMATKGIAVMANEYEMLSALYLWRTEHLLDSTPKTIENHMVYAKLARPYWRVFLNSESAISALAGREVALACIWNGDAMTAKRLGALQGQNITYVIPKEGALKWVDSLAIPRNSKKIQLAHQLINFLLRPEHMAEVTNCIQFANTSSASKKFIEPDVMKNPILYPDPSMMKRLILDRRKEKKFQRTIHRHFLKTLIGY